MDGSALLFNELMPHVVTKAVGMGEEARVHPIMDRERGRHDGVLVESALERVAVFTRAHRELALSDISDLRRLMRQAQVRRALLCVPLQMIISNPVMLLATLSKIEIKQVNASETIH